MDADADSVDGLGSRVRTMAIADKDRDGDWDSLGTPEREALIAQTPALEHLLRPRTRWERSARAPERVLNRMRSRFHFEKDRRPTQTRRAHLDALADLLEHDNEGTEHEGTEHEGTAFRSLFEASPGPKPQIRYVGTPISPNRGRALRVSTIMKRPRANRAKSPPSDFKIRSRSP